MSESARGDQAQTAALLETYFKQLAAWGENGRHTVQEGECPGLENYTVLDVGSYDRGQDLGGYCPKAITVMDPDGNIYVHFNGTGDGNWELNAAAYSEEASAIQKWSQEYCDNAILENYIMNTDRKGVVYLSGHSQGGNNAQYAMLTTKYDEYVDSCISLDGPGFSHKVVNTIKDGYSTAEYNSRVDKIYAYNGSNDFVSPLGQEQVVREDHSYFVKLTTGYRRDGENDNTIATYHMVEYMLDGDGKLGEVHAATDPDNGESAFRKMVRDINEQVNRLPEGAQKEAAIKTMKLVERYLGKPEENLIKGDLSVQDFCQFLEILIPILITTAITNPDDLIRVLAESGAFGPLSELIAQYPILAVVLVMIIPGALKLLVNIGVAVVVILAFIDYIATVIDRIISAWNDIREFCKNAFQAIKDAISAIKEWGRNTFNRGVSYVQNHPSFRGDPALLRDLANDIAGINSRLRTLDGMMNDLYWQVGFLDLWDILCSNLLTSGSPTLLQVQNYLNNTASRIENAESQAAGIIGG